MDSEIELLAASRHGVFSTAEARSLGHDGRSIARMVHKQLWVRIRRGYFTLAAVWAGADLRQRHLLSARAAVRSQAGPVALIGSTGAVAHGLEIWQPKLMPITLVRLDGRTGGTEYGVTHLELPAAMPPPQRLDDDFLCAPPAWTALTAMLDYPLEGMVVIADSAQQHKLTNKTELTELAESWQRRRDTRALRVAVRLSDGRAANGGETLGRIVVFWRHGLPRPELQFRIDGPRGQLAFTDYVWEDYRVVGEFDGKRKYLRDVDPGTVSEVDPGEVVWREKQREDWLTACGWTVRRLVFADIYRPAAAVAQFREALIRGGFRP